MLDGIPKDIFFFMQSNACSKILPLEKLTFANLALQTDILLFFCIIFFNLYSIINLDIPIKLVGSAALSVEIENIFFKYWHWYFKYCQFDKLTICQVDNLIFAGGGGGDNSHNNISKLPSENCSFLKAMLNFF